MTLIVTGKGDFSLFPLFQEGDFPSYELYLRLFEDVLTLQKMRDLPAYIKISSIHNPTWVDVEGNFFPFDLTESGRIGEESLRVLQELIVLGEQQKVKTIVIHGATFNSFTSRKEDAFALLVRRIKPLLQADALLQSKISLTFENDVLWHNLFYSRRALLTGIEDFIHLDRLLEGKVKITADFEHLHLSFYFSQFVHHVGGEQEFLRKYPEHDRVLFEQDVIFYITSHFSHLNQKYKEMLCSFFRELGHKIEHVHINGSDCFHFVFNPATGLPLVGEHLPINFNKGGVCDKLDYDLISQLLSGLPPRKNINVVLEVWRTDKNEFIQASRESRDFLRELLKMKMDETRISETKGEGITMKGSMSGNTILGKSIRIRNREITDFAKPFIIAEIGSNHNGDIELAKKMIDAAVEAGADCAKFQSWTKSSLFSKGVYHGNKTLEQDIDKYSFDLPVYKLLKAYCDTKGIIFASSVFCEKEADFFVDQLGMEFIKIASMDVTNHPFLEYVAKKGKPILLSTGLSTLLEIAEAVEVITQYNPHLIILHCLSVYPDDSTKDSPRAGVQGEEDTQFLQGGGINLNNMDMLRANFGYPVGFSDNTPGLFIPLAAAAKGACVIEKHFTVDKNLPGWDHAISADLAELKLIVQGSAAISAGLGTYQRVLSQKEINMRPIFRRSIVLNKDVSIGHVLSRADVEFKRPGTGIGPKNLHFVLGRVLKRDLKADDLIKSEDLV